MTLTWMWLGFWLVFSRRDHQPYSKSSLEPACLRGINEPQHRFHTWCRLSPFAPHSSRPLRFKAGERGTQTNGVSMFNRSLFVRSHCGIFSDADHVDDVDDRGCGCCFCRWFYCFRFEGFPRSLLRTLNLRNGTLLFQSWTDELTFSMNWMNTSLPPGTDLLAAFLKDIIYVNLHLL